MSDSITSEERARDIVDAAARDLTAPQPARDARPLEYGPGYKPHEDGGRYRSLRLPDSVADEVTAELRRENAELLEACKVARRAADADAKILPGSAYYRLIHNTIQRAIARRALNPTGDE